MNPSNYRFTLDLHKTRAQVSIPVKVGDTNRVLCIYLSEGGKPYTIPSSCLAMVSIERPTGTYIQAFCPIVNNSYIKYDFSENQYTAIVEGLHDCDVILYSADGRILGSPKFTMVVHSRVVGNDDIDISDSNITAIDSIIVAEVARVNDEIERAEAEKARIIAEEQRVIAEEERVIAEQERVTLTEEALYAVDRAIKKANQAAANGGKSSLIVLLGELTEQIGNDGGVFYTATASHSRKEIAEHINNGGVAFLSTPMCDEMFVDAYLIPIASTNYLFDNLAYFYSYITPTICIYGFIGDTCDAIIDKKTLTATDIGGVSENRVTELITEALGNIPIAEDWVL